MYPSKIYVKVSLCLLIINFIFSVASCASPVLPASPEAAFSFASPEAVISSINPGLIRFNFGTTTSLDDKYAQHGIEHTFTLINRYSRQIFITEIQPSSICIKKFYLTDGKHTQVSVSEYDYGLYPDILDLPFKLAPGAQVQVFVSIDPMSVFTGSVDQSVDVMVEGQAKPAATLQMVGVLQSGISFSPTVLDFHQVTAGKLSTLLLSITLDRRLHRSLPNQLKLKVTSNNSDISVTKLISDQANKKHIAFSNDLTITSPKDVLSDYPTDTKTVYKVTLSSKAEIGVIKGYLSLISPAYPNLILLVNAHIPFAGEVAGEIKAFPPLIVFGDVPVRSAAMKVVTITVHQYVKSLKVLSASRKLIVHLIPYAPATSATKYYRAYQLEVTISPHAPIGVVEDKIVVITPSGHHLVIPIFAAVSSIRR